jgi:ankyrin repeat protein
MDTIPDELIDQIVVHVHPRYRRNMCLALKSLNRSAKTPTQLAYAMVRLSGWRDALISSLGHGELALVTEIIQYMAKHGVRINADDRCVIVEEAASCQRRDALLLVMEHCGGWNVRSTTPQGRRIQVDLARNGFLAELQSLIAREGASTVHGVAHTPMCAAHQKNLLRAAACGGRADVVEWALTLGTAPLSGAVVCGALGLAVMKGHADCARALMPLVIDADGIGLHAMKMATAITDALCMASSGGNEEVMGMLLRLQHNPPHADCQNGRALSAAARGGHASAMRLLLLSDHPPRADCDDGYALLQAVHSESLEAVSVLMSSAHPPRIQAGCNGGHMYSIDIILAAVETGNAEMVRLLLSFEEPATDGNAMYLAVQRQRLDMVRLLERLEQRPAPVPLDFVNAAAETGNIEMLKHLNVCMRDDKRVLSTAAQHGHLGMVRWALQEFDWSDQDTLHINQSLWQASRAWHHDIIVELIGFRIKPTVVWNIVSNACLHGDAVVMRRLVSPPYSERVDDSFNLLFAASSGNVELATMLLDSEHPPPRTDCREQSALIEAARHGHARMVDMLLARNDPPRADSHNGEALVVAAAYGDPEVVSILLRSAHPPRGDCQNSKALIRASSGGHIEVVMALMRSAHPPRVDAQRWKAVCDANHHMHIECVSLLLTYAAPILRDIPADEEIPLDEDWYLQPGSVDSVRMRFEAIRAPLYT